MCVQIAELNHLGILNRIKHGMRSLNEFARANIISASKAVINSCVESCFFLLELVKIIIIIAA